MTSVLVVDDEPDLRHVLAFVLGEFGCDVHEAVDGESALAVLRRVPIDAVVLDLVLPGIDGLDVLATRAAERLALHAPIVVVSGVNVDEHARRALALGADRYVAKPFDPVTLVLDLLDRVTHPAGVA